MFSAYRANIWPQRYSTAHLQRLMFSAHRANIWSKGYSKTHLHRLIVSAKFLASAVLQSTPAEAHVLATQPLSLASEAFQSFEMSL